MEIKGNIGEIVYIKARVEGIRIDEEGVTYFVKINQNTYENVMLDDIKFDEQKQEEKKEKKAPKPIAPKVADAPKKRGRPRKTTVDDLLNKAKGV